MDLQELILSKNIKAVIFDCDGTLVDSESVHYAGWKQILKKYGHEFEVEEYSLWIGKPIEAIAKHVAEKMQIQNIDALIHSKREHLYASQSLKVAPISDTLVFLQHLAKEKKHLGIKLGLASASAKKEIMANLKSLEIEPFFDVILSGHDDLKAYEDISGTNKPKPYIYLEAAKILNIHPSECIAVEDSEPGVISSVQAGCFTIAVPNPYTARHDFSNAHLKIESFKGMHIEEFFEMIPILNPCQIK